MMGQKTLFCPEVSEILARHTTTEKSPLTQQQIQLYQCCMGEIMRAWARALCGQPTDGTAERPLRSEIENYLQLKYLYVIVPTSGAC